MNIQTNPTQMEKTSASFPAITEEPIRSHFLPEDRLRTQRVRRIRMEEQIRPILASFEEESPTLF